jgi:hypothetical protein
MSLEHNEVRSLAWCCLIGSHISSSNTIIFNEACGHKNTEIVLSGQGDGFRQEAYSSVVLYYQELNKYKALSGISLTLGQCRATLAALIAGNSTSP